MPMVRETGVESQVAPYQKTKNWYLFNIQVWIKGKVEQSREKE